MGTLGGDGTRTISRGNIAAYSMRPGSQPGEHIYGDITGVKTETNVLENKHSNQFETRETYSTKFSGN